MEKLTVDLLVSLTGVVLSLLAFYLPPFKAFLDRLSGWKFAFMAGALLVVAVVYQAMYCGWQWDCFRSNLVTVLMVWIAALGANQAAYQAVVKPAQERS